MHPRPRALSLLPPWKKLTGPHFDCLSRVNRQNYALTNFPLVNMGSARLVVWITMGRIEVQATRKLRREIIFVLMSQGETREAIGADSARQKGPRKSQSVSIRCGSLPSTNLTTVMYPPATCVGARDSGTILITRFGPVSAQFSRLTASSISTCHSGRTIYPSVLYVTPALRQLRTPAKTRSVHSRHLLAVTTGARASADFRASPTMKYAPQYSGCENLGLLMSWRLAVSSDAPISCVRAEV